MAKKAKAKKSAAKKRPPKRTSPVSQDLPGMEDRAIGSLEKLAEEYAGYRDDRMAIGQHEIRLKGEVLAEMKKLGKTRYHRDGITIEIVTEQEGVKVKVKKSSGSEEDSDSDVGDVS